MIDFFLVLERNCEDKPLTGNGKATQKSFYFNVETGCCEDFTFGGRETNGNRYVTLDMCQDMCETDDDDE